VGLYLYHDCPDLGSARISAAVAYRARGEELLAEGFAELVES
jgi:hypothetical protein